jgi:hypothetical protein
MNMSKKALVLGVVLGIIGGCIGFYVGYDIGYERATQASINSFEECAQSGNPIQESYPEVCRTPDGKSFTKEYPPA